MGKLIKGISSMLMIVVEIIVIIKDKGKGR